MGSQVSKSVETSYDEKSNAHSYTRITESELNSKNRRTHHHHHRSTSENVQPELTLDTFVRWKNEFERDDKAKLASTILSKQHIPTALIDCKALSVDKQVFSNTLTVVPTPITNQRQSGRCWLFATCNIVRMGIVKKFNLGDFELSESYLFFYDHLEKSNYYLENMIELAEEPLDARIVSQLSSSPQGDGGQWDMAVVLIEKYGLVPKSICEETYNSNNSNEINEFINSQLRAQALELRQIYHDTKTYTIETLGQDSKSGVSAGIRAARQAKETMMANIHRYLAIALGSPPSPTESFKWEYVDRNGKAHSLVSTPLDFYHKHCAGFKASEYINVINDPRHDYNKSYTIEHEGNVWGSPAAKYVNTTSEVLKRLVIKMIKSDRAIWFGCDVGKMSSTKHGIMDTKLINYEAAFGSCERMTKAERIQTLESTATHAMVITAVHLDEQGRPVRYKVENSWSKDVGSGGYFVMTDDWFDEFLYEVVIHKSILPDSIRRVYDETEPIVLPNWDPLAGRA